MKLKEILDLLEAPKAEFTIDDPAKNIATEKDVLDFEKIAVNAIDRETIRDTGAEIKSRKLRMKKPTLGDFVQIPGKKPIAGPITKIDHKFIIVYNKSANKNIKLSPEYLKLTDLKSKLTREQIQKSFNIKISSNLLDQPIKTFLYDTKKIE